MKRLAQSIAVVACLWAASGGPANAQKEPSLELSTPMPVELELLVTRGDGEPVTELSAAQLLLLDDGQARSGIEVAPVGERHLLLLVDLLTTQPAQRHRALPGLQRFLADRAQQGDRITMATLGRRPQKSGLELLCRFCSRPAQVNEAFEALARHRSAAFHQQKQLGVDARRQARDAFLALAEGLGLARGDGRLSSVFYLGAAATAGLGEVEGPTRLTGSSSPEIDIDNVIGSVQYLVSMPRAGPLSSLGRHQADRLLATALEAGVTIYPLVDDRQARGPANEGWLAKETGGESLSIRHLDSDLARLGQQLDDAYRLTFRGAADQRFHQLEVRNTEMPDLALRHRRAYHATSGEEALRERARAAWRLQSHDDDLELRAELEPGRREDDQRIFFLRLSLPIPEGAETRGRLSLALAVIDAEGTLARVRPLPFQRVAEQDELRLRIPLRLSATAEGLGLALRDDASGRISSLPLRLPALSLPAP